MSEPMTLLAELSSAAPDPAWAERTRVRCRARLAQPRPRFSASASAVRGGSAGRLWQPAIVLLGVGYLTQVAIQALRVYGLL